MARVKAEITFASATARDHFLKWLCDSGEQQYWQWMEYREEEEDGPITATTFDYHTPNEGRFGPKVSTTCGCIDERRTNKARSEKK